MYGKDYIEQRDVDELVALMTAALADAGAGFDADTVERAGTVVAERRLPLRAGDAALRVQTQNQMAAAAAAQHLLPGFGELGRQQSSAQAQQRASELGRFLGGSPSGADSKSLGPLGRMLGVNR